MSRLRWRKVHVDTPAAWQNMSYDARALGTYMMRLIDDDNTVALRKGPAHETLSYLMGVEAARRRVIKRALEELVDGGFVVEAEFNGKRVLDCDLLPDVGGTRAAQSADNESKGSARVVQGSANGSARVGSLRNSKELNSTESFNTASAEKSREEKKREDSPVAPSWPASNLDRLVSVSSPEEQQRRDVFWKLANRYADCRGDGWQAWNGNRPQIVDVAAYVVSASEAEGVSADVIVDETLRGFFADTWARNASWPWKLLAKDPARYRGGTRGDLELDRAKAAYDRALAELTEAGESGRKDLDELIQRKCAASDAVRRIERERINRNHRAAQ